jgi:rhamnulokinase
MNAKSTVLAFDYGASSGRAMLSHFDGTKIDLCEVHRFSNEPVEKDGTLYWNFDALFNEMMTGIKKAQEAGGFDSIGVDTWGVDFGLLDSDGKLMEQPVHYRDSRTDGLADKINKQFGEHVLYSMTGTQLMDINTLFQLYSLKNNRPEFLKKAKTLLLIPDLFNYYLTGQRHAELSEASTTQMLDLKNKKWNDELLEKLDLPREILPEVIMPGTKAGMLREEICEKLGVPSVPVISVTSHDTASAVLAIPAKERKFIFIACGTWSLFGTEREQPLINVKSETCNITNELGFDGRSVFLKNIIGLWLIQETRREFRRKGKDYSYAQMEALARESRPFACFIDPDAKEFVPTGDIPGRVIEFCKNTGQYVPQTDGEIIRCIYESLAMKYRYALEQIKSCTNDSYEAIHLVGGGTKDSFLCQMTADATDVPVIAGPIEATALGNAAAQFISLGIIKDLEQARDVIRCSFTPKEYVPEQASVWREHYEEFKKIVVI